MSNFRRIGPEVAFGDVHVAYDDVVPLVTLARGELFLVARTTKLEIEDDSTSAACAIFHGSIGEYGNETPNRSLAVKISDEALPEGWRLTIGVGTFFDSDRHSKKQIHYKVETTGDEVLEATKAVRFILGTADIVIDDELGPIEAVHTERKMYERPMETADCEIVARMLQQTVRRQSI